MYILVAFLLGIIFPGFPITIELLGTLKFIYAPGATKTLFPISIFPTVIEFAPNHTLLPIL